MTILEVGRTDFITKEFIESGELCYLDVMDINIDIWKQLIYHKNK